MDNVVRLVAVRSTLWTQVSRATEGSIFGGSVTILTFRLRDEISLLVIKECDGFLLRRL